MFGERKVYVVWTRRNRGAVEGLSGGAEIPNKRKEQESKSAADLESMSGL